MYWTYDHFILFYSLQLGFDYTIILNEYAVAKDAIVNLGDDFSDRMTTFLDIVS
jgi:hypothetical protein